MDPRPGDMGQRPQDDLQRISNLTKDWKMELNSDLKLHQGSAKCEASYSLKNQGMIMNNHKNDIQDGATGGNSKRRAIGSQGLADISKSKILKPHLKPNLLPATPTFQDKEKEVSDGDYKHTDAQSSEATCAETQPTPDQNIQLGSSTVVKDDDKQMCHQDIIENALKAKVFSSCDGTDGDKLDNAQPHSNVNPERLNTKKEDCPHCDENGFHTSLVSDFDSHETERGNVLEQCKQKIGKVECLICGFLGNCFRIGKCSVVTCHHVIRACEDANCHKIRPASLCAVFNNQGLNQQDTKKYFVKKKHINEKIDLAVCELRVVDEGFPPAFTKLRDSAHHEEPERLVYLVCFQNNEHKVHSDTVRLESDAFDEERLYKLNLMVLKKYPNVYPNVGGFPYESSDRHREKGHVPLLCKVIHGGSGGVGVFLDKKGDVVVDFMYRGGYPGYFHKPNTDPASADEIAKFPSCLRVQVGVDITFIKQSSQEQWWECEEETVKKG